MTRTCASADLISRITEIDREVDHLDQHTIELVEFGTRGGAGGVLKAAEDKADARRAQLLAERANVVEQLKQRTGVS